MNVLQRLIRYFKADTEPEPPKLESHQVQLDNHDYINPYVRYMIHPVQSQQVIAFSLENMMQRDMAIHEIDILLGGFVFRRDHCDWYAGGINFNTHHVRWYGRYKHSHQIMFDLNMSGRWYQICLLPDDDNDRFTEHVMARIPEKFRQSRYYNRPNIRTYMPTNGAITTRTLQGFYEAHEKVELHITPLWLIAIVDGQVIREHFIDDIKDIQSLEHPTASDYSHLLSFTINKNSVIYAVDGDRFAKRLSDAAREGIDAVPLQKKKT